MGVTSVAITSPGVAQGTNNDEQLLLILGKRGLYADS